MATYLESTVTNLPQLKIHSVGPSDKMITLHFLLTATRVRNAVYGYKHIPKAVHIYLIIKLYIYECGHRGSNQHKHNEGN